MLRNTRNFLDLARETIDRVTKDSPGDRAFLEAMLTGYVSTRAYSEIETVVGSLLRERFFQIEDVQVAKFLENTFGKGQGRLKKSDISDLVCKFGDDCKEAFNQAVPDKRVTEYHNLLEARHSIAHDQAFTADLHDVTAGIDAAELLLLELRNSIRRRE